MKKIILFILAFIVLLLCLAFFYLQFGACGIAPWSCGDYPSNGELTTQQISVGDGPEDMAIDHSTGVERILVSCTNRRQEVQQAGAIYQINLKDNSSAKMIVSPSELKIFPHGIDVVTIESTAYLYAISHHGNGLDTQHKIFRFEIKNDTLIQDESYVLEDPMLTGPNDIDVLSDGQFYVSNPMPSNDPNESTKAILGIKNGNVLHYDGQGNWSKVLEDMCYPNGVFVHEEMGQLLVANGGCKAIERFPISDDQINISEKESTSTHQIDIPIGDNLMLDNQGMLWTAAHPCPIKFLAHSQDSNEHSPAQIFSIDPNTMTPTLVFQNEGELISAASTVIHTNDRLYISQVFDPFVLVVEGLDF